MSDLRAKRISRDQMYIIVFVALAFAVAISILWSRNLENQIYLLEKAQLHEVKWNYSKETVYYTEAGTYRNVTISGTLFNSGICTAANCSITFRNWAWSEGVQKNIVTGTWVVYVGNIPGIQYKNFEIVITLSSKDGAGYSFTHEITYTDES